MRLALPLPLLLVAAPAHAHPHIFIDAGFEVMVEDGRLAAIRTTWAYDDYYSLLITEDMKLDADADGVLSAAEQAELTGFDMEWQEGFNGDLVATLDGAPLALSGPEDYTATLTDGRIITTHLRRVEGRPPMTGPLSLKPYDSTYYTAYDVTLPVTVAGADTCMIDATLPDMDAAAEQLQQQLSTLDPSMNPEDVGLADPGAAFATEVRISCPAP